MPYISGYRNDNQDVPLYVEDVGSGAPVVLLHPWPLTSLAWERQIPALVEAGFRVITFDRRGFGRSGRPWGGYDYATLAGDLEAVVTACGLDHFSVVASSMGGGEILTYLRTYGDARVRSIVLASSILPAVVASSDNPEGGMSVLAFEDYLSSALEYRVAFLDEVITTTYSVRGEPSLDELSREFALRSAVDSSPRAITETLRTWAHADMRADLALVTVPVLVLHGGEDALFPVEGTGLRTQAALSRAELAVIDGGPHGLNVTHAAQFNAAITAFLQRPS